MANLLFVRSPNTTQFPSKFLSSGKDIQICRTKPPNCYKPPLLPYFLILFHATYSRISSVGSDLTFMAQVNATI